MSLTQRHTPRSPEQPFRMTSRLLLLTDRSQLPLGRSLLAQLLDCVDAGATAIVVRELDLPEPQRAALAGSLAEHGATVIAARSPLPAAVGLHLPAGAPTPPHQGFGRSCHTPEEVRRAAEEGAAYATLSPYAETPSKPGYGPALPADAFAGHPIPVYALAGITPENAAAARAAGAYGVAVMGDVMRSHDPAATVAALLEAVGE